MQPARYTRFFYIFLFPFFIKIYFRYGNLQKYTPSAQPPGGRDLAARQPGGRGFSAKKTQKIIADRSLGPVARLPGGRPPPAAGRPALPPLYKGWLVPPPLICITTIPETKKREREEERRSPAGFSSRRLQVTKILLRFTNSMIVCPDMSSNYFC